MAKVLLRETRPASTMWVVHTERFVEPDKVLTDSLNQRLDALASRYDQSSSRWRGLQFRLAKSWLYVSYWFGIHFALWFAGDQPRESSNGDT